MLFGVFETDAHLRSFLSDCPKSSCRCCLSGGIGSAIVSVFVFVLVTVLVIVTVFVIAVVIIVFDSEGAHPLSEILGHSDRLTTSSLRACAQCLVSQFPPRGRLRTRSFISVRHRDRDWDRSLKLLIFNESER